jgi:hypothetical protein
MPNRTVNPDKTVTPHVIVQDNFTTGEYETVAASATAQVLGTTGAAGDYHDSLVIVVETAATAQVQITDGAGSAITIFPNSPGGGIGTYVIPIKAKSVSGAWKVTTGAGASVIATGNFT